jgi:hypothetical protein
MIINVARHHQESFSLPTPILEHLAWAFSEVERDPATAEHGALDVRAELMHHVPEFYSEPSAPSKRIE